MMRHSCHKSRMKKLSAPEQLLDMIGMCPAFLRLSGNHIPSTICSDSKKRKGEESKGTWTSQVDAGSKRMVPERLELSAFALHDIPLERGILVRRSNQLSYGTSGSCCGACGEWMMLRVRLPDEVDLLRAWAVR
jgi:hypothetical protein